MANYDEIGHRTGPEKKRTQYIADTKQATGQLITEIQIGQRMLGIMFETSARYAQRAHRQWRQRHANGSRRMMIRSEKGTYPPPPPPHPTPPHLERARVGGSG